MFAALRRFRQSYFLYDFLRDSVAVSSFALLAILILSALFAPIIAPHTPYDSATLDIMNSDMPPAWINMGSSDFLLGTDNLGRGILSAILYGLRVSLLIGFGAVFLQSTIGIAIGLISGYGSKRLDSFFMRIADIQLSFSSYMVAIFFGAILQTTLGVARYEDIAIPFLICVIGFSEWPQVARTVRASVLAEKNKEYVEAAKVIGLPPFRIMFRHILPNTLTPVLVVSTVQVANAIMSEAALSFLGLGMPVTQPSLGSLIKVGFQYFFSGSWWITLFPGLTLILLVLSINLLGDWLRDYLNPKIYKD